MGWALHHTIKHCHEKCAGNSRARCPVERKIAAAKTEPCQNQQPRSHYKKGGVTLKLLGLKQDDNPLQEKLFSDTEKLHVTGGKLQLTLDEKERDVWVLVHYSIKNSLGDYQVKAELSQPATYDNNGYINTFANSNLIMLHYNPERLRFARERRGLTKKALADAADLDFITR